MDKQYNHDLCFERHASIEARLEKGEKKMSEHDVILHGDGNGRRGAIPRLATVEDCIIEMRRERMEANTLFWRIATPCIPTGILALAVGLWYLFSNFLST